jgi:FkbM family methyltransferase
MKLTTLPNGTTIATIDGDTHIGAWAIEAGRVDHDQSMLPLLRDFLPNGGTVIDVGAYIGDHAVFYADCVGVDGAVIAFEPNPEAFACLHHNTKGLPQVIKHHAGASNSPHTISIATEANGGASFAIQGDNIACITIDSLNLAALYFIKLDCEGMEVRALQGAMNTIARHSPVMLIEVNAGALERQGATAEHLLAFVRSMGYDCRNVYAGQEMEGPQFDIICEPRPSL